jgi:hypothetical protein
MKYECVLCGKVVKSQYLLDRHHWSAHGGRWSCWCGVFIRDHRVFKEHQIAMGGLLAHWLAFHVGGTFNGGGVEI